MPVSRKKEVLLTIATLLVFGERVRGGETSRYLMDIERFEGCTGVSQTTSPIENPTFLRINRTTRAFSFTTHLKRPIDENIGMKAELEKWGSRGWIQIPFMPMQPDACNVFRKLLGGLWVDTVKSMGVKEPEKCPIPAGRYEVKNYMYDTSTLGSFAPFKGKFRYRVILVDVKTGEVVQCIQIIINVTDAV